MRARVVLLPLLLATGCANLEGPGGRERAPERVRGEPVVVEREQWLLDVDRPGGGVETFSAEEGVPVEVRRRGDAAPWLVCVRGRGTCLVEVDVVPQGHERHRVRRVVGLDEVVTVAGPQAPLVLRVR